MCAHAFVYLSQRHRVAQTLQRGIHEARVSQISKSHDTVDVLRQRFDIAAITTAHTHVPVVIVIDVALLALR